MRQSLSTFIDTCFDIKVFFAVDSYELHDYEDGDYADFKVTKINNLTTFMRIVGSHEFRILAGNGFIIVRVFENYEE